MKSGSKRNQVIKLKHILMCFIYLLGISHRTIKRDAIWWSWQNQKCSKLREIPRVIKGNQNSKVCWDLSYRSNRFCIPVRSVGPIIEQVRSIGLVRFPHRVLERFFGYVWSRSDMSDEHCDRCNLNSIGLVRPFSEYVRVLTQLCYLRKFSSVSGLSRFWSLHTGLTGMVDRSALTALMASFF
jgi:hypothetical protein